MTKNAILLVDNANQRRGEGVAMFEALAEAGKARLRPIMMTTLAMIVPVIYSYLEGLSAWALAKARREELATA